MSIWKQYIMAGKRFEVATSDEALARDTSSGEEARHACGDLLHWAGEAESEGQITDDQFRNEVARVKDFLRRR